MTKRYGIWDLKNKRFVFNIDEESKNRAMRRLQQIVHRPSKDYVVRPISSNWKNPPNPKYKKRRAI